MNLAGSMVNIPRTGRCARYFAVNIEFTAQLISNMTRIVAEIRSIECLKPNRKTVISLNLTGLRVDIP